MAWLETIHLTVRSNYLRSLSPEDQRKNVQEMTQTSTGFENYASYKTLSLLTVRTIPAAFQHKQHHPPSWKRKHHPLSHGHDYGVTSPWASGKHPSLEVEGEPTVTKYLLLAEDASTIL